MTDLELISWPVSGLDEAVDAIASKSGLPPKSARHLAVQPPTFNLRGEGNSESIGYWIESAAKTLGLEAEPIESPYSETIRLITHAAPALLVLPGKHPPCLLALIRGPGKRRRVHLLAPDRSVHRVEPEIIRSALCHSIESPIIPQTDRLLEEAEVSRSRRQRVKTAILESRLNAARVSGCWIVRMPPGSSFWLQARKAGLLRQVLLLAASFTVPYLLYLLSWWLLGAGVLSGRFDKGMFLGWALLYLTVVPFGAFGTWSQGMIALGLGALLRQRLLFGALKLRPEEVRHQGAGQLLGRVFESDVVETLALNGGFTGLFAVIKLAMAMVVLALGAAGTLHAALLLGWVIFSCLLGWRYFYSRRRWSETRLAMTHDVVERMVGHRTRLAQEARKDWHEHEDRALDSYVSVSAAMDADDAWLRAVVPRGWLVVGLLGIVPAFLAASASSSNSAELALSLGGILFSYRPLQQLASGLSNFAGAAIAWKQVSPLFHAAARTEGASASTVVAPSVLHSQRPAKGQRMMEAADLVFTHEGRATPALQHCSLTIDAGDRVLLEGPSGGGKSTLASLLAGLRLPHSGLLMLEGLDRKSMGIEEWRRRVVVAPQFHENFVLTETFAFNLLMGRRWPPRQGDFEEAETICRTLGLGEVLDRMPAGLLQMVGESGWQLSHGERSRLFIARALLQGADVVVLDESFGSLDPATARAALECVLERAPALIVIGHL